MELNAQLSPKMRVKPLEPGETVTFELLNRYKKEAGREEPSCPDYVALAEKETIFDPFANEGLGKMLVLQNITSLLPVDLPDGRTIDKPVLKKPVFIKGVCTIGHEQQNEYIFLMRSKGNADNPFSKKGKKKFRIVNTKKATYEAMRDEDIRYQAEKLVREGDWTARRAIAHKLNQSNDPRYKITGNIDSDLEGTLLQLIKMATAYPKKVIMSSNDIEAKARVYISDAQVFGLLIWNGELNSWSIYQADAKKDKIIELLTVDPGSERIGSLLAYFKTSEGQKNYVLLVTALQKVLRSI